MELLIRQGAEPDHDLQELWRRIVFSIAIRNTDDHLRNHGFLLTPDGWRLSPTFDVNPEPDAQGLSLNITETSNALDFEVAGEVAEYFRLEPRGSDRVLDLVKRAVRRGGRLPASWEFPEVSWTEWSWHSSLSFGSSQGEHSSRSGHLAEEVCTVAGQNSSSVDPIRVMIAHFIE